MSETDDAKRRTRSTLAFTLDAVRLVRAGQELSVAARVLGMPDVSGSTTRARSQDLGTGC